MTFSHVFDQLRWCIMESVFHGLIESLFTFVIAIIYALRCRFTIIYADSQALANIRNSTHLCSVSVVIFPSRCDSRAFQMMPHRTKTRKTCKQLVSKKKSSPHWSHHVHSVNGLLKNCFCRCFLRRLHQYRIVSPDLAIELFSFLEEHDQRY